MNEWMNKQTNKSVKIKYITAKHNAITAKHSLYREWFHKAKQGYS